MYNNKFSSPARRSGGKATYNGRTFGGNRQRSNRQKTAYIDPKRFVNKATTAIEEIAYIPTHMFRDFPLEEALQLNIEAAGYVQPTPIQDGAIPAILEGKDVIGLANTGTGKTAAFVVPIINSLMQLANSTALIVAPTRELALQIDEEFRKFSKGLGLGSALCVGGMNIHQQIETIRRGPAVIIGTPGRLKDLINRRVFSVNKTGIFVLDEADQMLDMGFVNDIRFLINMLPEQKQALCFSATVTPEIQKILNELLKDPVKISVRTSETSDHVEQNVVHVDSKEHKMQTLHDMLAKAEFEKVLIFGETKHGVQRLADGLSQKGIAAEAIHGNKSQPQRQRALRAFKQNQVRVLVATDVAARGLDIPNVSHVINFDQPSTYESYVHRIGRTGRAGNRGNALTFLERR